MPAFADIVVNDGETTPVAHTFKPTEINSGVALYHDRATGVAIGYPRLGISLRMPTAAQSGMASDAKGRVVRSMVTLDYPIMESTSASTGTGIPPAPTVAYVLRAKTEWILPERSTLQNRKNLRAMLYNALNHANVKSVLEDLEAIY